VVGEKIKRSGNARGGNSEADLAMGSYRKYKFDWASKKNWEHFSFNGREGIRGAIKKKKEELGAKSELYGRDTKIAEVHKHVLVKLEVARKRTWPAR